MTKVKRGPWTILNQNEVHESPWIKVTQFDVLNPSNNPGNYSTISFKNLAIGIIPLDRNGDTWIVGQYRFPIEEYSWEIPEGGGKKSVSPLESAKRELREEVGIDAKKWTLIQEMKLSNSASDEHAYIYLAQDLSFFEPEPDEDEKLEMKKIHFNELLKMVESGEITDSLTVVAVYKIKLMLVNEKLKFE